MNRTLRSRAVLALAILVLASSGAAGRSQTGTAPRKAKLRVLTGEIVDIGCYTARGFKGPSHRDCGTQCVRNGVPKGLLAAGDTVFVLMEGHDRAMAPTAYPQPDPFVQCGDWVSQRVEVSGLEWEGRDGARFLEVRAAKLAPLTASQAPPR